MRLADLDDAYSHERPSFSSVGLLWDGDARSGHHPPAGKQMRLMIRGLALISTIYYYQRRTSF